MSTERAFARGREHGHSAFQAPVGLTRTGICPVLMRCHSDSSILLFDVDDLSSHFEGMKAKSSIHLLIETIARTSPLTEGRA